MFFTGKLLSTLKAHIFHYDLEKQRKKLCLCHNIGLRFFSFKLYILARLLSIFYILALPSEAQHEKYLIV